jgi:hypothetical protein
VSLALIVAGVLDLLIATPDVRLLVLGLSGCALTMVRCIQFALASDLRGLPPIEGRSEKQSRLFYQAVIAWLHLVNPVARMWGRIKGMSSMPQATAAEHVTRRPWKAPLPGLADILRSVRLGLGGTDLRAYWSESWVDHTHLLNEMVGVVRAARPDPPVEVDEWRPDRDFSLAVGRWGFVHVQVLVEEHAQGKCLMRVRSRLRARASGMVRALALALTLTASSLALMSVHWRSGSALAIIAAAIVVARTAWQTMQAATVFDRALAQVVDAVGMMPIHNRPEPAEADRASLSPEAQEGYQPAEGA